jgi:hypothetical protein
MCMNCGCGEADKRHHPTDITRDDVQRAADGGGMSLEDAARNLEAASEQLANGQPSAQAAGAGAGGQAGL